MLKFLAFALPCLLVRLVILKQHAKGRASSSDCANDCANERGVNAFQALPSSYAESTTSLFWSHAHSTGQWGSLIGMRPLVWQQTQGVDDVQKQASRKGEKRHNYCNNSVLANRRALYSASSHEVW
jgi:hypothetical protein